MSVSVTSTGIEFNPSRIFANPLFWGGTALIVFSYFTAKGSSQETGQGIDNALTILAIGGGAALLIYAINKS
jgi:hypothetical protein